MREWWWLIFCKLNVSFCLKNVILYCIFLGALVLGFCLNRLPTWAPIWANPMAQMPTVLLNEYVYWSNFSFFFFKFCSSWALMIYGCILLLLTMKWTLDLTRKSTCQKYCRRFEGGWDSLLLFYIVYKRTNLKESLGLLARLHGQ